MAVTYIAGASGASQLVATLDTGTFTIGSQANRCLVCLVEWSSPTGATVTSVRWDPTGANQSLSQFGSTVSAGNRRAQIWSLVAPAAATAAVRVTWNDATIGSQGVQAAAFGGVHQTTPLTDQGSQTTAGTTSTITVANVTADDGVIDGLMAEFESSVGADQTVIGTAAAPGDWHVASRQSGSAGGVMSWTCVASGALCHTACRIAAAGGGGGGTWLPRTPTPRVYSRRRIM